MSVTGRDEIRGMLVAGEWPCPGTYVGILGQLQEHALLVRVAAHYAGDLDT